MKIKLIIALSGMAILVCKGLQAQDITPANSSQNDTALSQINKEGELINVPFNINLRKNLPGFITTINPGEFLMYDNISSASALLTGRSPGIIAGTNMHGLGAALVFIDGIPGDLSDVNVEEIEQITILKDVNSAMFYGVQAGRGIIMVTTRRGKAGKPVAEVGVDQGFSNPVSLPKYLGAAKYMELYNEARKNDGLAPQFSDSDIEMTQNGTNIYRFPDTDYHGTEFLKSYKPFSRYRVNFSGGNTNTQYFLNVGWTRTGSLLAIGEKEQSNLLNIRSNVNFRINNFLKAYIDIAGKYDISKGPNGNFWSDAATLRPHEYTPLIDTSMVSNLSTLSKPVYVQNGHLLGGTNIYRNNVYGNLLLSGYQRTFTSMMNYRTGLDVDLSGITRGLSFRMLGSFTFNSNYTESQNNTYAVYQPTWTLSGTDDYSASLTKIGNDVSTGTQGISNTYKRRRIGYYGILDYSRIFNNRHDISASVLAFSNLDRQTDIFYETKFHHMGTRLNYALDNKYIIDFNSVLTSALYLEKGNRLGYSPSVGLGWVISREDFFGEIAGIDYLKLKASKGVLNTDVNISQYYLYKSSFVRGANYTWSDGTRTNARTLISNIGNSQLGYEKRNDLNVGAEAMLLNNTLWLDVNYFQEKYSDILTQLSASTPDYNGGLLPWVNYGEEKYTGADLAISYRKTNESFSYEIGGNFTYLKSKLVKTDETWGNDYQFRAGKRTDGLWGLEADGLFRDSADVANHESQSFGPVGPGDIKYIDQNDDGIIDQNDMVMIGNSIPDFSYGLHVHLNYGNLSFFTLLTGSNGHEAFTNNEYYWVFGNGKYSEIVLDRWAYDTEKGVDTRESAKYPRLSSGSNSNNFRNSTFWLYDYSRLSINCMQLTYDIQPLAARLNAKNLGLYLRAENIAIFSKNRDKIQLNHNSEPQYSHYSIGIRAIF
jgi:TonB-linked SusC/RagA family outer membrane protein